MSADSIFHLVVKEPVLRTFKDKETGKETQSYFQEVAAKCGEYSYPYHRYWERKEDALPVGAFQPGAESFVYNAVSKKIELKKSFTVGQPFRASLVKPLAA
jgi:hypothetical protein